LEDRTLMTVFHVNTLLDPSIAGGVNPATGAILGLGNGHVVSLRSAIDAANMNTGAGSNMIELMRAGTYKIMLPGANTGTDATGAFAILPHAVAGYHLTIENASGGAVTVDGNHLDRVFDINPNFFTTPGPKFLVTLAGFTITNGLASSATAPDGPDGSGGGIRDQGNASLTLFKMVVTHNSATADGGGVSMENVSDEPWKLVILNSVISDNHAGDAGGGVETDGTGLVNIANSLIAGNTCVNQGGGIWLDVAVNNPNDSATLHLTGDLIINNQALVALNGADFNDGGGVGNAGNSTVTIIGCTFANNYSAGVGGGFGDQGGLDTLVVQDSLFVNNSSGNDGGGIFASGPSTSISHTEIKGNGTGGNGGGLFAAGGVLTVTASTIADNTAAGGGGGIELETIGTGSTITTTTITGNYALNNAGSVGGGIEAAGAFTGTVALLNDTITGNVAAGSGGGIFWQGGNGSVFSLQNTILAQNFVTLGGLGPDAFNGPGSNFTDNGGNLIGTTSGATGFTAATDLIGVDPLLGPLGNNGGPVVGSPGHALVLETEALEGGSPAIGAGVVSGAPGRDERGGNFLKHGGINMGAVSV
jgi:hypothetical protein